MKVFSNHKWGKVISLGLAVVLAVALMATGMMFVAPAVSAASSVVTVDIPDDLAAGAKVSIYPWNSSYIDGGFFNKNIGDTVTWRLIVNGFTGKDFSFKVTSDPATLTVGPDAYCKMKVINVPDGGKINVYPWNTNWSNNNDGIFVPIGSSCKWKLIVNGFAGNEYTKNFDCTPLDAKQAWIYVGNSSCSMKVQIDDTAAAAGYKVNVYPWNTYWSDDALIVVPLGGSLKWRLVGNGFTGKEFTKKFDCSPLVVNGDAYCTMEIIEVPTGSMKVNVYPWNTYWSAGDKIIVPIGGSCTWKLVGPGAPTTQYVKNFDCTPLDASTP